MSADKMPPLPAHPWRKPLASWEPEEVGALHAYARAYAAEQTRELVEALEKCADILRHEGCWPGAEASARALIAKHKEQA